MTRRNAAAGAMPRRVGGNVLNVLGAVLALSVAAGAFAHEGRRGHEYPLSLADARDRAEARFQALDTDGSGEISLEELAASQDLRLGHRGFRHGREGDRQTTDADLFAALDANGDGLIAKDEFSADKLRDARLEAVQARVFAKLDDDGSGGLSREELPSAVPWLTAMDADGDGSVTREEARAHRKSLRESGRQHRHGDQG